MAEPIPFGDIQQSGRSVLSGAAPSAMNVILDERGTLRRRPGITATVDDICAPATVAAVVVGQQIDGLYVPATGQLYIAYGAEIARVTVAGCAAFDPVAMTTQTQRPIFAETEMLLVIANGDIRKVTLLSGPYLSLLAGDPPVASHILANASRLLANDIVLDRTKIRYSEVAQGTVTYAGFEIWTPGSNTAGFFTAEARPDKVLAIAENTNEVFVFGAETLEVFSSDPALVFGKVCAMEVGCAAAYSVAKADSSFYWLDPKRRFVRSNGRSYEAISTGLEQTIKDLSRVDDCYGYCAQLGLVDVLVWTFPTDGRTFVYQPGVGWGQWAGWDDNTTNWLPFMVSAHHQRGSDSVNLVGTNDGRLGAFDFGTSTDLGQRINAYVETGFLDRGTAARKICRTVRLILKRGETATSGTPRAFLSFRDKPGAWEPSLEVELGASGETEAVVEFRNLGVYRHRAWRFQFDGPEELILVRAEEEFEVVGG